MANQCEIKSTEVDRMAKTPGLATDYVKSGVYTQRQVDACSADQPSNFDKLKGALSDAFGKAKEATVAPLDQAVKAGVGIAVDQVTENTGGTGRVAEALQNRPAQLKAAMEYN